ncbi:zinc ribbon domain-containing protein [Priestia taiwanensis]|uniref:Zinc ribbon domain-containing protein n=1 Tax=Priestia taiwanensis TaxID=1347902 RepID=A0A917AXI4_9BACI|nr:zinc-ribbon domain-containing protein [Priestia taiwanensis]MBM7364537.1 putative membrane protein YvbJ [Priestia taiwanensis]GGE80749.1 zinc ribbon domain-containing protein [Priestia taiwanensis]
MSFCQECGNKMTEDVQFCQECGTKIETTQKESEILTTEKVQRQPLSKKNKIVLGIGLGVAILFGGLYMLGSSYYSQEKVMERFMTAIQEEDTETIVDLAMTEDPNLKIDEDGIQPLLSYIKENPSYLNGLQQTFVYHTNGENLGLSEEIELVKDGKKFGIFDKYVFKLKPYYVEVTTNGKGTVVYNGEQEIATSDESEFSKELGPFLPGVYQFKAAFKDDLVTLDTEKEVVLMNYSDTPRKVDLQLKGHYITVQSNVDDGILYVNGEEKGKLEDGAMELGPIPNDGSVEIHLEKEFPFGKVQTEKVKVKKNTRYKLEFKKEVSEDDLERFITDHLEAAISAINSGIFSYVEPDYDESGPAYKQDKDYMKSLYDRKIKEELVTAKLEKTERVNETQYKLYTYEEFNIIKPDSEPVLKKFNNVYLVTVTENNRIGLHSLVENKEIK